MKYAKLDLYSAPFSIGDVLCQNEEYWLVVSVKEMCDLDFDTDEACTKTQYTLLNIFDYETYGTIKSFAWDLSETEYLGNFKNTQDAKSDSYHLRKFYEENVMDVRNKNTSHYERDLENLLKEEM